MKKKTLVQSLNYAIMGIIQSIKCEKHMQIHVVIGILVILFCFFSDLTKLEFLLVIFAIAFVIVSEMINTAIENTLDAVIEYRHPLVKSAKDISAGAVLISVVNAVIIGYVVFWDRVKPITETIIYKIKNCSPHIIFAILTVVVCLTVILKIISGKGTPLKGGMPSGHSAVAFCIATVIAYYSMQPLIVFLGYVMALIVAQSRVDSNTHSILEVILGGLLGFLITLLILILI